MVEWFSPGKTFFYGLVIGAVGYAGGRYLLSRYIDSKTREMKDSIIREIKQPSSGCNPGYGEFDAIALYSRLISTLERIDSRLSQMGKTIEM